MLDSPFRLPRVTPFGMGESVLEWATGLRELEAIYQQKAFDGNQFDFMDEALRRLNTRYEIVRGDLQNIPQDGPVVIVANHPFGGIEGIILASMVGKLRSDVKVLANQMLKRLPQLDELLIGVDVFGGRVAQKTNVRAIKAAHEHLISGGVLVVFPAGEVSAWQREHKQIIDKTWSQSVGRFIRLTKATTVPVFIGGHNSRWFYRAGKIHPLLRTAFLPRELLNKSGQTVALSVGEPISYAELSGFSDDLDITRYLRLNTYLMQTPPLTPPPSESEQRVPIIPPVSKSLLRREIAALPPEATLLEQGNYVVYCTPTTAIPQMMQEIGRVREIGFRAVGEGSNTACDVDEFDLHYRQLFVWNRGEEELVGAYRLGITRELIQQRGIYGLYSRSLFAYDDAFVESMGNSIEVGRSVVAPAYQRQLQSLLLLWKGIATFVYQNPQHTHLYGPVSISNDYSPLARQLMASVLSVHHYDKDKARLVRPTTPLEPTGAEFWRSDMLSALASVPLLSKVLARLEQGQGLPVLLRQYLGMNGKLVCFNVDPAFNFALDGLIVVDLTNVPHRTLGKYMGQEQARTYLGCHAQRTSS